MPYFYFVPDLKKENFKFGIGLTTPYGQATEWSYDAVRHWNYEVPYYSGMQTLNFTPAFSWKINPNFSMGIGANFYYSRLVIKHLIPQGMESKMNVDGTGYGGTVGFLYKGEKWKTGLTYKTGFKIDYDGKFKIPQMSHISDADVEIKFPQTLQFGIAFYPSEKLKIEFDTEYFDFSTLKEIPVNTGMSSSSIPKNWKDVYNFYFGTEYKRNENVKLRGGIARVRSPIPDTTWEPSLPDEDTFIISFGTELNTKIGKIEITIFTSIPDKKEKEGRYEGIYKSRGYFFTVGYKRDI